MWSHWTSPGFHPRSLLLSLRPQEDTGESFPGVCLWVESHERVISKGWLYTPEPGVSAPEIFLLPHSLRHLHTGILNDSQSQRLSSPSRSWSPWSRIWAQAPPGGNHGSQLSAIKPGLENTFWPRPEREKPRSSSGTMLNRRFEGDIHSVSPLPTERKVMPEWYRTCPQSHSKIIPSGRSALMRSVNLLQEPHLPYARHSSKHGAAWERPGGSPDLRRPAFYSGKWWSSP